MKNNSTMAGQKIKYMKTKQTEGTTTIKSVENDTTTERRNEPKRPTKIRSLMKKLNNSFKWDESEMSVRTSATEIEDFDSVDSSSIDVLSSSLVSFNEEVRIRPTMSLQDFTDEELHNSWYSREEYNEISRGISKELKKMTQGKVLRDKKYCERGLERFTEEGSKTCSRNKVRAIHAVLEEQHKQNEEGRFDENSIAQVYETNSQRCRRNAYKAGLRDAKQCQSC